MYHRLLKGASSLATLFLVILTWRWLHGETQLHLAAGALLISGLWLLLTTLQMRVLLKTYFDILSRLAVVLPLVFGIALSAVAAVATPLLSLQLMALAECCAWVWIYIRYRRNCRRYIMQGHGPLPANCWVNPDIAIIAPGDLILTSGRIATTIQESVSHAEMAIKMSNGKMGAFSTYMEKGTVINDLEWLISAWHRRGMHYIVLKLKNGLTAQQIAQATDFAEQMVQSNIVWRDKANARRRRVVDFLPLPASWQDWLFMRFKATGYDWSGLFIGTLDKDHWTCIGSCLELYHRLGVKTNRYGTGLFGEGTGILDPIMPVRFLADRAFRLVTLDDKKALNNTPP